ncbi:MAG TPA: NAD(P)-dependent oxidoreductase [Verrucomicrobiales bacterium]|nr:NAD(P)-dependent oxidoreductase [Verrucomicrobiales bacterium]
MEEARPTAWITGAGGLIGSHLVRLAPRIAQPFKVVGLTRGMLELTDGAAVAKRFRRERPRLVLHCAALSRSPDCQREPQRARRLNVEVTRVLADLAADVPLVLFSTDLVFDGTKGDYVETDSIHPMSVYAETKAAAEEIVLRNPRHLVIRTSLNAGASPSGDRGMDEQLVNAWRAGTRMSLFVDELRCPIPAEATARAAWELALGNATGVFHVAGAEKLSRWQIGELLTGLHPEFRPLISSGSLKDYQGAPRSPDTSMNCAKAQAGISFPLPRFSDWIVAQRRS